MKYFIAKATLISAVFLLNILLCSCNSQKQSSLENTKQTYSRISDASTTQEPTTEELTTEAPTKDEGWKQVYIDYLKSSDNTDNYEYALVNVDEDEIPELYKHGKQKPMNSEICWIYDGSVYSQWLMIDGFEYYEKDNLFYSSGIQSGIQGDNVYQIDGDTAKELHKGIASRLIKGQEKFTWNGKDVSEEEYNTLRKKAFDSSKANTVKSYHSLVEILTSIEKQ